MKAIPYSTAILLLSLSIQAHALQASYLYLTGISGNATPPAPTGWLNAEAFSFKLNRGAQIAARTEHNGLTITKRIDNASPTLARWICEGQTIPTLKLNLYRTGSFGQSTRFYELVLENAVLEKLDMQINTSEPPTEILQLKYTRISWAYTQVNETDSHWDLTSHTGGSDSHPDLDLDGMPDSFENAYGLNPAINDAHDDNDRDGLTNIQELYAGTRPDNPNSVLRVTGIYPITTSEPTTTEITWKSVAGKNYDLLYSTQAAGPYAIIDSVTATGPSTTNSVAIPDPNAYYRIQVHAE